MPSEGNALSIRLGPSLHGRDSADLTDREAVTDCGREQQTTTAKNPRPQGLAGREWSTRALGHNAEHYAAKRLYPWFVTSGSLCEVTNQILGGQVERLAPVALAP
jgi:hypothetical protein